MDLCQKEAVCSVEKENKTGYYRLHTIWKNNGFSIKIASKDAAWTGEMTPENFNQMREQLQLDESTYLQECKEALTSNDGKPDLTYAVENGSFKWKKTIDKDTGFKMTMGSVPLQPASFVETIQNIVSVALTCNKNLKNEVNDLQQEKNKCSLSNHNLENRFEELIKEKQLLESDLYSKFLLILNTKKRRILELEEAVTGRKISNNVQKPKSKPVPVKNKIRSKKIINDKEAYEMDTDNDTDEEKEPEKTNRRKSARIQAQKPDTSQKAKGTVVRKGTLLAEESSEHKKRKSDENDSDCTISDEELFRSCNMTVPGLSKQAEVFRKDVLPSTKKGLLDFFYPDPNS